MVSCGLLGTGFFGSQWSFGDGVFWLTGQGDGSICPVSQKTPSPRDHPIKITIHNFFEKKLAFYKIWLYNI